MRILKKSSIAGFVVLILSLLCILQAAAAKDCWIGAWASAQQLTEPRNLPPAPGLSNNTLRQVVRVSLGGSKLRVQFSNAYGSGPVTINAAHLAVSKDAGTIDPATDKALTFQGASSITIPAGQAVYSDTLDFDVKPLSSLAVSIYFGQMPADVTGHPGSRTTSYIQSGNAVAATDMASAVKTDHWYILSGIDLWLDDSYACVVTLGDSITDGRGSTTNGNDRWPDNLARRLQADPNTAKIGVLNQGIGGNAVVSGGLGPTALSRFEHDVLGQSGVRWVIILEGVNDIGGSPPAQSVRRAGRSLKVAADLIAAYEQLIEKAHAQDIRVYGVPILPFGGSMYDSEDHQAARQTVNKWIRTGGKFDAVIDLDAAVRDPANPAALLPAYDTGDHLHLNPAGYQKMAEAIDLDLFKKEKAAPVIGKSLRYCNPLAIETSSQDGSPRGVSLGDVTVVRENNRYYMFCTGGGAWVSEDLVNWKYSPVQGRVPVAPGVVKYNGYFYMSGNNAPLYRAKDILGPYEEVGDWKDHNGRPWTGTANNGRAWEGAFDVHFFIDDNKPYLYYPGRGPEGIYVVPLDPENLNQFAAAPKRLFSFDKSHKWERYGEMNEYSEVTWIEGPWIIKHKDRYYLEYSASGTQWLSYATGVYTSKNPLGPFTYAPVNPILRKTTGVVTGPAHGCAVEGPDGNFWQFYTIVLANPPGGRRIGMDPIGFDEDGNLFVRGPTETPQWAPGVVDDPARQGDCGSIPLTINKMRVMNTQSTFSSQRTGREAAYAVDNSNGTWWEPAEDDKLPSLTLDLGPATEFDVIQQFMIDSCRIEFTAGGRGFGRQSGTPPPADTTVARTIAHQYKIEASTDGDNYTTVLDKTGNNVTKYIEFEEIPPVACRFVRLTITDWPRISNANFGIMEFTVFGKPIEQ